MVDWITGNVDKGMVDQLDDGWKLVSWNLI